MSNDDKCPCVDGLPDPCTLCGAPADGVCEIDTLVGWKHRALRAEAEARQLRELCGYFIDACAKHRISVPFHSSLQGLLADIAAGGVAAVAEGAEDRPKFPGLHDRPDTGEECHYLAVTMPHGGLFCNKCWWAEGAEDRGQTDG